MNIDPNWFISQPVQPPASQFPRRCCSKLFYLKRSDKTHRKKLSKDYIRNNLSRIIIWILYILANLGLVIWVCIYRAYQQRLPVSLVLARIGGMLLDFNSALMVTLMLKRTILILRSIEFIRKMIPIDDHIEFHKIIGRFIALLVILHASGHMAHFALLVHSNLQPSKKYCLIFDLNIIYLICLVYLGYTWQEYMVRLYVLFILKILQIFFFSLLHIRVSVGLEVSHR
jgi:hypothetical protein